MFLIADINVLGATENQFLASCIRLKPNMNDANKEELRQFSPQGHVITKNLQVAVAVHPFQSLRLCFSAKALCHILTKTCLWLYISPFLVAVWSVHEAAKIQSVHVSSKGGTVTASSLLCSSSVVSADQSVVRYAKPAKATAVLDNNVCCICCIFER